MNKDVFEGKWKEMRGQLKDWWGKLTDDDLERVGGKYDQLIGVLCQPSRQLIAQNSAN